MPKILILASGVMPLYAQRLELVRGLVARGWEVVVGAPQGTGHEAEAFKRLGAGFVDIEVASRGHNPFSDLALFRRLRRVFKEQRPDVVLTFYTKTNVYGGLVASSLNIPYITNITGLGAAEGGGLLPKFLFGLYARATRRASCVFFQNRANRELFRQRGAKVGNGRLIPGSGVDLKRFYPMEFPEGPAEFLFVSRILKAKGIDEFIEAARRVKRRYPETRFHVVGPADKDYAQKLTDEPCTEYHGLQADTHPFIKRCQCFVYPSYYGEGMANVLLEAAASARPVITTSRPGCGETVDDGVTGLVVRERDSDDLVAKIEQFLEMPLEQRRAMGLKGREKMEREFSRQIVVDAYIEEIEKIIGGSRTDKGRGKG